MNDAITVALAVYGAVLTTLLAYLRHRANKPRIQMAFAIENVSGRTEFVARAVNTGTRKISIVDFGIVDGSLSAREATAMIEAVSSLFDKTVGEVPMAEPLVKIDLPARLDEGDQLDIRYGVKDVQAAVESTGGGITYRLTDTSRRHYDYSMPKYVLAQIQMYATLQDRPGAQIGPGFMIVPDPRG